MKYSNLFPCINHYFYLHCFLLVWYHLQKLIFIYLFVFNESSSLCWISIAGHRLSLAAVSRGCSSCSARASHFSGFSCALSGEHRPWGAQASVVAAHRLTSRGSQVLGHSSAVVGHGLSCSTARGIFLDQGLNLCLLRWQADSSPLSHQGNPVLKLILINSND